MRKLTLFMLFLIVNAMNAQSLKIIWNSLYYHDGKKFIEVKKRKDASSFQGYDVIDSSHVFIAYNPEISAEASVYIVIFDLNTREEHFVEELGATGESFFQYNIENDLVVFNWYNGINVFKLHKSNAKFIEKIEPLLLAEGDYFLPYWINHDTIGYHVWENGKWVVKTCKVKKEIFQK